jgi:hypothetical protein
MLIGLGHYARRCRLKTWVQTDQIRQNKRDSTARVKARDPEAWARRTREYRATYYAKPEKKEMRASRARAKKHGFANRDEMFAWVEARGNKCAICGGTEKMHIDHNHETGELRGLLCHHHNTGIGLFGDSSETLRRAAEYLEGYQC